MRTNPLVPAALIRTAMASGCGPQCEKVSPATTSVCRSAGAAIAAETPFTLEASPSPALTTGSCQVTVNGGQLELAITGTSCTATGAKPVPPKAVPCSVPALPAGTYSVKGTTVTFAVPESAGSALAVCP